MPLAILTWHYARTATVRWAMLAPVTAVLIGFSWWWTFSDRSPMEGSPHPTGIGLFMLTRADRSVWWAYLTVPTYAGCYPLPMIATGAVIIGRSAWFRERTRPWSATIR
ncbi:hypothetical protein ACFV4K_31600 [Nocardia sp. NPDC059764]|uniref:hypothetical protein n=1 Tax=Nocardia sp. NPDC059764 TaxID=3346939 RepID=UPI0036679AE7